MASSGKHHYILTGTSKGIGEALAQVLLGPDHVLWCISRNNNPRLDVQARQNGFELRDFELDLSQTDKIREVLRQIFRAIDPAHVTGITLVNNAGTIRPIREMGSADMSGKISTAVELNLLAPILLCDGFIRHTEGWLVPRRILNMSSGAASRPVKGWAAYCSAKAGLEMLSRCIAEEQEGLPHSVKIVSFSPGMVDTEMQGEIRSAADAQMPGRKEFVEAWEKGQLYSPLVVAQKIAALLQRPDFGSQTLVHIRDLN